MWGVYGERVRGLHAPRAVIRSDHDQLSLVQRTPSLAGVTHGAEQSAVAAPRELMLGKLRKQLAPSIRLFPLRQGLQGASPYLGHPLLRDHIYCPPPPPTLRWARLPVLPC